ncbi:hypothetical protein [Desulfosarcina sp.]|uniref:hypothetical protein n=1 Tax=Desulfosarcina sp. TaxID=2027861 RepID=UPI003970E335
MHIVYICSPDRKLELLTSIGSVLASGTEFERITVICVGASGRPFRFRDPRIRVETIPDISKYIWMENKTHLSRVDGDQLLFIDTDTLVFKPLHLLFATDAEDIAGRVTTASEQPDWQPEVWKQYLRKYGAASFFPYLNTGLLYFSRGAHRRIAPLWLDITRDLLARQSNPFGNRGQSNQHAFSLACGAVGLSCKRLSANEHAYGWIDENYSDAYVYHTGKHFIKRVLNANQAAGVLDNNPMVSKYRLIFHVHM